MKNRGNAALGVAKKVWDEITLTGNVAPANIEEALKSKFHHLFHVGPWYYYVFNVIHARFEYIDPQITSVLGYSPNEMDAEMWFSCVHPEDQAAVLNFEKTAVEFFRNLSQDKIARYKFSYDLRFRNKDGKFIRILQQILPLSFDANSRELLTLGVHTDITHIKPDGKPTMSFIGFDGEPSYYNVDTNKGIRVRNSLFTEREKDIIRLLISGAKSAEIARELNISQKTVDTHRRNILIKAECRNTTELAVKVVSEGLI